MHNEPYTELQYDAKLRLLSYRKNLTPRMAGKYCLMQIKIYLKPRQQADLKCLTELTARDATGLEKESSF